MSQIELIGINGNAVSGEQRALLQGCCAVVASRRLRFLVDNHKLLMIDISPVSAMLTQVEAVLTSGDVAVLASGDPLFYGIGRSLIDRFGPERIRIHPALSAVQLACARFCLPWDDLPLISLHGRLAHDLPGQVLRHRRALLFTDNQNTPNRVAAILLAALEDCADHERLAQIRIRVAENLGLPDERLSCGTLAEIIDRPFAPLNMVLIEQLPQAQRIRLGLCETEIQHSRGLITKDEIRAATLHRLQLPENGVFWDIGGGSGSVSLEAAGLCPNLSIYTIEKKPEEQANIRANIRRYGAYSIHPVNGEAPEALAGLPAPDRIFIGGSGQRLEAILETAVARLKTGGRLVVNAVLEQSATTALSCLQRLGLQVTSSTLALTRHTSIGTSTVLNPITLITGDT